MKFWTRAEVAHARTLHAAAVHEGIEFLAGVGCSTLFFGEVLTMAEKKLAKAKRVSVASVVSEASARRVGAKAKTKRALHPRRWTRAMAKADKLAKADAVVKGQVMFAAETGLAPLLRLLTDTEKQQLGAQVLEKKRGPWELAADGLRLMFAQVQARQAAAEVGSLPRRPQSSTTVARAYGEVLMEAIYKGLCDDAEWVSLNTSDWRVSVHERHPGPLPKTMLFDLRPDKRAEWLDTENGLSVRSVQACLLGYARPAPNAEKDTKRYDLRAKAGALKS